MKGIKELNSTLLFCGRKASRWQDNLILLCKKTTYMNNLLYIIAVILVIGWLIGFIGFHAGGLIHILLVIAVVAVLLRLIRGEKV